MFNGKTVHLTTQWSRCTWAIILTQINNRPIAIGSWNSPWSSDRPYGIIMIISWSTQIQARGCHRRQAITWTNAAVLSIITWLKHFLVMYNTSQGNISIKFYLEFKSFQSRKCVNVVWKIGRPKGQHCVSLCLNIECLVTMNGETCRGMHRKQRVFWCSCVAQ